MNRTALVTVTTFAVAVLAACTPGGGDNPTPPTGTESPTTGTTETTPTEQAPTPLSASETAQEAVRLWVATDGAEPERRAKLCALFDPEAVRLAATEADTSVPMSKWCSDNASERLPESGYRTADRNATIEEQISGPDGAPWVRLEVAASAEFQYVAALAETENGWLVTEWCTYGASQAPLGTEGDPFGCLRAGQ